MITVTFLRHTPKSDRDQGGQGDRWLPAGPAGLGVVRAGGGVWGLRAGLRGRAGPPPRQGKRGTGRGQGEREGDPDVGADRRRRGGKGRPGSAAATAAAPPMLPWKP